MAVVKGFQQITGSLQNTTFYTIQGSDRVYVRTKGGPSKRMIKTSPAFEKVRCNNEEWKGCTQMASAIREAFRALKGVEDYPVIGSLNAMAKQIQSFDTGNNHGRRALYLSQYKELLAGFSLSRKQVLENVLRVPITALIHRETGSAGINIPAINTGMYLYNYRSLPYFRIIVSFSSVCDICFSEEKKQYAPASPDFPRFQEAFVTEWLPTSGTAPALAQTLQMPIAVNNLPESVSLVLSVGVEFGNVGLDGLPSPVKYTGTGKIMDVK